MITIPPKHPYSIVVSLYGQEFKVKDWASEFRSFAVRLSTRVDIPFRYFYCTFFANNEILTKELRLIPRNSEKIDQFVRSTDLHSLGFSAIAADAPNRHRDYDIEVFLARPHPSPYVRKPWHQFFLMLAPPAYQALAKSGEADLYFLELFREVESFIDVRYGLVNAMPSDKLPALYFSNISTNTLSTSDRNDLSIWRRCGHLYQKKIRGVYWGNLITDLHLGENRQVILNELGNILGTANVQEWSEGKYFFLMPTDLAELSKNSKEFEQIHGKLHQILAKYELFMEQASCEE